MHTIVFTFQSMCLIARFSIETLNLITQNHKCTNTNFNLFHKVMMMCKIRINYRFIDVRTYIVIYVCMYLCMHITTTCLLDSHLLIHSWILVSYQHTQKHYRMPVTNVYALFTQHTRIRLNLHQIELTLLPWYPFHFPRRIQQVWYYFYNRTFRPRLYRWQPT